MGDIIRPRGCPVFPYHRERRIVGNLSSLEEAPNSADASPVLCVGITAAGASGPLKSARLSLSCHRATQGERVHGSGPAASAAAARAEGQRARGGAPSAPRWKRTQTHVAPLFFFFDAPFFLPMAAVGAGAEVWEPAAGRCGRRTGSGNRGYYDDAESSITGILQVA